MFLATLNGWIGAAAILTIDDIDRDAADDMGCHRITYSVAGEIRTALSPARQVQAFLNSFAGSRLIKLTKVKTNAT